MYVHAFKSLQTFIFHIHLSGFIHLYGIFNVKGEISTLMQYTIFPVSMLIKGPRMARNYSRNMQP